ncbi:hypothetical protein Q1695_008809 [Nippostrongylus brasiliensis]|nr:hypothetical protein Q1695_008809 [Nippostrongylus brasiliensis]
MPMLPKERTQRSRPFQNVGLDYLGPITAIRDGITGKTWICLITCMATRAIHLEVVLDNSAQEFLLAFRRFVARRGAPRIIYSDNSTTFHAAENIIKTVLHAPASWKTITDYCTARKIIWRFITPLSPWKGGFYERLVALFKSAYRKSIGRIVLTLSQLQTVVTEIEATLNSRPITPYRQQDSLVCTLRPVDFLIPELDSQLPFVTHPEEEDLLDVTPALVQGHREMLQILDQFWEIWRTDYLDALRDRQRQLARSPRSSNIVPQLGDIVIIAEDRLPRGHWPYGLVTKLHFGKDGNVRSVEVRISNGKTITRSPRHLYPLELNAIEPTEDVPEPLPPRSKQSGRKRHSSLQTSPTSRKQPSRRAKSMHRFIRTT